MNHGGCISDEGDEQCPSEIVKPVAAPTGGTVVGKQRQLTALVHSEPVHLLNQK